jgi:hypothetical protein
MRAITRARRLPETRPGLLSCCFFYRVYYSRDIAPSPGPPPLSLSLSLSLFLVCIFAFRWPENPANPRLVFSRSLRSARVDDTRTRQRGQIFTRARTARALIPSGGPPVEKRAAIQISHDRRDYLHPSSPAAAPIAGRSHVKPGRRMNRPGTRTGFT